MSNTKELNRTHRSKAIKGFIPGIFLILPAIAIFRAGGNSLWIGGYAVLVSIVTYLVYAWDKRKASEGAWRVSEMQLHFLELIGGWPGAYLAQRTLHHKNAKLRYQIVFWIIVIAYQCIAIDSLLGWRSLLVATFE